MEMRNGVKMCLEKAGARRKRWKGMVCVDALGGKKKQPKGHGICTITKEFLMS